MYKIKRLNLLQQLLLGLVLIPFLILLLPVGIYASFKLKQKLSSLDKQSYENHGDIIDISPNPKSGDKLSLSGKL